MADDIDIEEHDVLDNPRIKNIFPDLTRIKTEAPDPDDDDHHMHFEYSDEAEDSNTRTSLQVEYEVHNNHIILGTKRVANPAHDEGNASYSNDHFDVVSFDNDSEQQFEFDENIEIKQEPEDSNYEEIERHGSCIILGSKPNRPAPEVEVHDVYSSVVALEDWGPRLERSNCYCKDCAILFPTRNCLDAHNMAAHSFLVAMSNDSLENQLDTAKSSANKAVKSTTKNIQFSTTSSLSAPSTSKGKFCNHCNKTFPSDTALITHLYDTLTAKKFPCKLCDRIFNKETELAAHIESRHSEADNDDESFDDSSDTDLYNKCHICGCYFVSDKRLDSHMLFKHSLKTYPREKTRFKCICEFCGSKCGSPRTYNTHVVKTHRQIYTQKPGNSSVTPKLPHGLKSNVPHKSVAVNSSKLSKHLAQVESRHNEADNDDECFDNISNKYLFYRCHICSCYFVTAGRLDTHMESKHSLKTYPSKKQEFTGICKICRSKLTSPRNYNTHVFTCHRPNYLQKPGNSSKTLKLQQDEADNDDESFEDSSGIDLYHRCHICSCYFIRNNRMDSHMLENHSLENYPRKKIRFLGICKLCGSKLGNPANYNRHVFIYHRQKYIQKPGNSSKTRKLPQECKEAGNDESINDSSDNDMFNRCHICSCYFICDKRFHTHMVSKHSLENFPREKTQFIGICKLCGSRMGRPVSYNKHVLKFHPQKYIQKPGNSSKIKKLPRGLISNVPHKFQSVNSSKLSKHPASSNDLFQCTKCGKIFASYGKARYHKDKMHANISNISIVTVRRNPIPIPKKNLKVKKQEQDQSKSNKFVYKGVVDPPIAKSVLFKCSKCPLHFTSCSDAVFHSYNCRNFGEDWKCPVCSRSFALGDKTVHERQHNVSDRFMVHSTNDSVYGRTLCQCPKCDIYYSEQEFWVHIKQGCGQPKSVACNECNILIHVSSTKMHKQLHKSKDFTANQLILIEFVSIQDKDADDDKNLSVGSKRKISKDYDASDTKKAKFSTENEGETATRRVMYFCETCNLFSRSSRAKPFHLAGKCKSSKHGCKVCKKCGLTTSYKSVKTHNNMHILGYTIFDLTYIRMQDNKVINPMPTFPKCLKCGVHFLTKSAKLQHDCNVDHKMCIYCHKKFSDAAYRLHVPFHHYANNRKYRMRVKSKASPAIEEQQRGSGNSPEKSRLLTPLTDSSPGKSSPMPELLKKYEQLTKTWNILYLCEVCDVVCDSYDKVVEHSQDHFNNMESYNMSIENCEICDLRFDATCFDKHKDLHDENAGLDRQFFNVLQYNYINLLSDNWFELFRLLPAAQMEQIVSQSIYAHNRNIRMRILQDGPSKNTVYKCGRCYGYLTASMVEPHMKCKMCSSHRYKCTMCKLDFKMISCLTEHQIACQVTHQTYREVLFNDANDMFNQSLQETHEISETPSVVAQTGKTKSKGVVYRFLKCDICGCCSVRGKHSACGQGVKCPQCDLLFERKKGIFRHRQLHKRYPKLCKRTVTVIHFTPEAYKSLPKLYKCQCGLHFTSLQTIEKHLTLCEPGYSISKENCSKCGLLFPTAVLVSHLCSHHSNDKRTEFHIIHMAPNKKIHTEVMKASKIVATRKTKDPRPVSENMSDPRKIVYKCYQCNLCCMAKKTLDYHFAQNHKMAIAVERCDMCGMNFTKSSLKTHITLHHDLLKCSRGDISVKVYRNSPHEKFAVYANDNSTIATTSENKYSSSKEGHLENYDDDNDSLKNDAFAVYANDNSNKATTSKNYSRSKEKQLENYDDNDDILKDDTNDISVEEHRYLNRYLYQCTGCGINFLNPYSCETHYKRYHVDLQASEQKNVSCDICGLTFSSITLAKHEKIHHQIMKLNRDDFIVIKSGMVTSRNLYKCEECDVHFTTHFCYVNHCSRGIHSIGKIACDICGYNFAENLLNRHTHSHHTLNKFSREDFNIITNVYDDTKFEEAIESQDLLMNDGDNDESTVVAEDETQRQERKRRKCSYKPTANQESLVTNRLYKCRTCALHFYKEYSLIEHLADASVSGHNGHAKICEQCDLKFSLENDLDRHIHEQHEKLKLTLKELLIIENDNDDDTNYATKYLYKCAECATHFLKEDTAENHQHSIAKTKCEKCGLVFDSIGIKDHIKLHHKLMDVKFDDFRYIIVSSKTGSYKVESYLSERFKTSLRNCKSDNSIYPCKKGCGLNYITLRSVLDHSLSCTGEVKKIFDKKSRVDCEICGLTFTGRTLGLHRRVQHNKLKLKLEDFCIRSDYDLETFSVTHSESQSEDFGDTSSISHTESTDQEQASLKRADVSESKENFDQMAKRPKYQFNKGYLSSLDLNTYSNQLFKCNICETHYLTSDSALKHEHSKSLRECCPDCGLLFTGRMLSIHQYIQHQKFGLTLSDFAIQLDYSRKKYHKSNFPLYKCRKCDAHFVKFMSAHAHTEEHCANTKDDNKTCEICGLKFSPSSINKHEIEHHCKNKLTANDFNIINYSGACRNLKLSSDTSLKQSTPSMANMSDIDIDESETSTEKADESEIGDIDASETSSVQMDVYTSSISHTESTDQEQASLKRADVSESKENFDQMAKRPKYQFNKGYLSSLDLNTYSNQLFKCNICETHYVTSDSALKHEHRKSLRECCPDCGLLFTGRMLSIHQYIQHQKFGLTLSDFAIQLDYSRKKYHKSNFPLYKCRKCDAHFVKFMSAHAHTEKHCANTKDDNKICEICGLKFSPSSINKHEIEHHRKNKLTANDFNIINYSGACRNLELSSDTSLKQSTPSMANMSDINIDESETSTEKADELEIGDIDASETSSVQMDVSVDDLDSNAGKVKVADSSTTSHEKVIIKLYKCGDCNVYYLTQTTCYKHMINHQKLDSLEYIECKLCGLQFRILTLRKHMNQHKTNFNLENVLVEEYRTTDGKTPKIDIYYALDKIQSRLVSTTTESKDVSESNVDSTVKDIVIPVDDQENTEKEVSNPIVDQTATDITSKDLSGPTTTEVLATDVCNPILTENGVKDVSDLATDGTVSKITPEVRSPSVEAESTSTDKDIVDSLAHNVNVKDNDCVLEENVTVSVVAINEPSLSESVTDSTEKQDNNSVATEDKVLNDVENNHDLNRIQTESVEGNEVEVTDVKTLTNQEDELT